MSFHRLGGGQISVSCLLHIRVHLKFKRHPLPLEYHAMSEAASNRRRPSVDPDAPLTADQLEAASSVEIFDQDGKKSTFGELIQGKRTVAVFIRHFCASSPLAPYSRRR